MKFVAVTQRVSVDARGERRDALDRRWHRFLAAAGLRALALPNDAEAASALRAVVPVAGVVLTGGNDLAAYGGDAPERDALERELIREAEAGAFPLLGVCRGMQMLLDASGAKLERVEGHVAAEQTILIDGRPEPVNSYHCWGARSAPDGWEIWARAEDGVVKAVRREDAPIVGVMWHPERLEPFAGRDLELVRGLFGG